MPSNKPNNNEESFVHQTDEKNINDIYTGWYEKFGFDSRSVGYSEKGQLMRYDILSKIEDLTGKSVLEIGSGLGHFYQYLNEKIPGINYTGFEINPNFVKETQKRFPNRFFQRNIMTSPVEEGYDAVFAVGIINTKLNDNEASTRALMSTMFKACKKFCALTMASKFIEKPYITEYSYYYDPAKILDYALTLTPKVNLVHDYAIHDFMIVLKKS